MDQTISSISRDDMLELLGNLLDNAYKWAKGNVLCTLRLDTALKITIEDCGYTSSCH